ncbi:MAG: single-stranded DNA-binding protein [Synergistes sp.]|nr:single-stranded DNA-binding protein [Synergistes sp.]
MSKDFNKVILVGRLARDPDVRFTPNKQKVARITLATGRQWRNKATGETQSHTDFIPITVWGTLADICERYTGKGKQILVEGRISTRDYDDVKTGQHKWVTEVVAENIVLLGGTPRKDGADAGYGAQPYAGYTQQSDALGGYDMGSMRNDPAFGDDFPMDISEPGGTSSPGDDVDIPF